MLSTKLSTGGTQTQPLSTASVGALSERDLDLFNAIVDYKRANDGCAPGNRELMKLAGMSSTSVVAYHLGRLAQAGLIESPRGRRRQLRVRGGHWTLNS